MILLPRLSALALLAWINAPLVAQDSSHLSRWHFVDRATIPTPSEAMPAYARMLYNDEVDLLELERAFEAHYADRDPNALLEDLERDPFAKFIHHWIEGAQNFVDDEGKVRALSTEELLRFRAEHARSEARPAEQGATPSWSFVGPRRTLWRADHRAGQPTAPWQVNIYCICAAPSDPSVLYCGSETGALYKSVDRGLEWVPLDSFNWGRAILSVAVHPTDPEVAYAATSTDVFKSTDGGDSWSIVLTQSGLSCNSMAISPSTPNTLFAGTGNGLYRSTDGGASWTQSLTEHVDDVMFRPNDGLTLYVLSRTGGPNTYSFYKSTDGGVTFALSMSGWGTIYERSGGRLSVTPADPDYVYAALLTHDGSDGDQKPIIMKSADSAGTWTAVATCNSGDCPMTNGQGYYDLDIAVSHVDPEQIIAATTTAYRSSDGGATWTAVGGYSGPFGIHPDVQEIITVMDGGTENTWITTDGGVNLSTDFYADTANWEARIDGLDGTNFWGFAQGWNEDYLVGGRYHNGNTVLHENYPDKRALRLGGAESVTGWALHGRERHAAFDDIAEMILPASIDQAPEGSFLFTKHPQNYYYGDAFSQVLVDVEDFMTVYLGRDNSFWRSTDGGGSWEALYTFGGKPYHFDISRAEPDFIYLTADDGFYRSTDRGLSFTEMSLPPGFTNWHSQNLRVAASSTDRDVVWVLNQRSGASSSVSRVFVSQDGGVSWNDLTTAALQGRKWTALAHQVGTQGGIYIASNRGEAGTNPARVLYRDDSLGDWVDWSAGLPPSANPIKLLPFYRDGKLRWGGNRGAWEIDFYEQDWAPIAQPFVSGRKQICVRDTVEFDSYSIAKAAATYSWSIPGADWTSDLDQRQVQATFPAPGTYTATLTVTQDGEVDSKAVDITLTDECDAEGTPGNAIDLPGASSDYVATARPLGVTTNSMTMSAWIKRDGNQPDYAGIVFMRQTSSAGLNFRAGASLGYHWNNSRWWWNSGLVVPDGEWAHVAMVVTPTEVTLYLNGVPSVDNVDPDPCSFDGVMNFGADPNWSGRRFKGSMDEVVIYDRALSRAEIREMMHLTRDPANDPGLMGYWQFNRNEGIVTDRAGTNHASLLGASTRVRSTVPVGSGASGRQQVFGPGAYDFGPADLTLEFRAFAASFPDGELCVTRIDGIPDRVPNANVTRSYWVVRNYGSNPTFDELASLTFRGIGVATEPERIELFKRPSSAEGASWGFAVDSADSVVRGPDGTVTFRDGNGQSSFSQFIVSFDVPTAVRDSQAPGD